MLEKIIDAQRQLNGEPDELIVQRLESKMVSAEKYNRNIKADYGYIYNSSDYSDSGEDEYLLDLSFSLRFKH